MFFDKNKYIKNDIAVEFETLCSSVDKDISPDDKENFHEFLRSATNTFTQNVYWTKDSTYNLLKPLQRNTDIVLLSGDKDSSVVILDKACHDGKINRLIHDGISKGVYVIEENDNILTELKSVQNFIYRNFKKHEKYKEMRPTSSQPARLFATAKSHKFTDIKQININDLKLPPIIDQTGTQLYDCSKIIAQYLQPLAINKYTISDTLSFPDILRENPFDSNEEYVSYDADSLFTNIPLRETIDFTLDEIYIRKKLEPFCKKLVFKKLLNKLCKGCTFLAASKLIRQINGCPMGGPMSVFFSNIFCVKMEFDAVKPLKPKLYKCYVDDTYSKWIKNQPDQLFEKLNNYHPNIKLTIEVNPSKFLDTKIMIKNGIIETSAVVKKSKIPNHWSSAVPKKYKRSAILGDLHRANKISSNFELEK